MKENQIYRKLYFLGIGGIGMSALARYYAGKGVQVSGYDKTETSMTQQLVKEGIQVHYSPDIEKIPADADLVVFTPAVPVDNEEFVHIKQLGLPLMKRSEAMAQLVNNNYCIAVAGTHGKTTITALITHILKSSGREVLAFVGGLMKNYQNNLVFSNHPEFCVVEADEFDRSFLKLKPQLAVISAIDADHLDIYGDFQQLNEAFHDFARGIKTGGYLVVNEHVAMNEDVIISLRYGTSSVNGLTAKNIRFENGEYSFDMYKGNQCLADNILFPFAGIHNVENALAAAGATMIAGVTAHEIKQALGTFEGIHRRFDFRIKSEDIVFIDDYAHHPREIDALVKGVRGLYPEKKVTGIFQPHLFSRTRDFADEFARSLEKLDQIIITDIYPARELPIQGINADFLLEKIQHQEKFYCSLKDIPGLVEKLKPDVLLTIGAGDIDTMVQPLQDILLKMNNNNNE